MSVNSPPPGPSVVRPDVEDDEREFEAFASTQSALDIEAATWVARQRNGLDALEHAKLRDWLQADPLHRAAFEDMKIVLAEVGRMPRGDAGLCPPTQPRTTQTASDAIRHKGPRWWQSLQPMFPRAAVIAVAFLVGAGAVGWEQFRSRPSFEQAYVTERGEQLAFRLPDATALGEFGSEVQLDTLSQAEVSLFRDRREVRLKQGQAMFAVQSDPQRPFHVWVGPLQVTVVGTRFSARHTASGLHAGRTVIAVEEGRVSVTQGGQRVELGAGQMMVTDDNGRLSAVTDTSADALAPWRNGRVSFEQTPLAEALSEFERYAHTGVVVSDPAVAKLPVGGSYNVQEFERFVKTLPRVLPVSVVSRNGVTEVIAR